MSTVTAKATRVLKPNLSRAGASLQESVLKELVWARRAAKQIGSASHQIAASPAKEWPKKGQVKKRSKKK
jgi:hypothetical protein